MKHESVPGGSILLLPSLHAVPAPSAGLVATGGRWGQRPSSRTIECSSARDDQQLQEQLMSGDAEKAQADMAVKSAELEIQREEIGLKPDENQIKYMDAETRRLSTQAAYAQAQSKAEFDSAKQALEVAKFQLEQDRALIEARMKMIAEGGTNDVDEAMMADMHRQLTSINESLSRIQISMMAQKPNHIGVHVMTMESPEMEGSEAPEMEKE